MRIGLRVGAAALGGLLLLSACTSSTPGEAERSEVLTTATSAAPSPGSRSVDVESRLVSFLDQPSAVGASLLAAEMGRSGDPRWAPYLLDLLRFSTDENLTLDVSVALEAVTGEPRGESGREDYLAYGSWIFANAPDPGSRYREWKEALYGSVDPAFEPLLAEVPDIGTVVQLQWGGVVKGGIPELNDPRRVPATEVDFLDPGELVLGADFGDLEVAYPLRVMARHELVNDTVNGRPVGLAYCTLCRTATAYERRVGDTVLTFRTSGLLLNSNKVMVDDETSTLWRQLTGRAFAGPLTDTVLDGHPVVTTTWADWLAEHPESEVVTIPEASEGGPNYDYTPGEAYRSYYEDDAVWFPVLDTPDVFPLKTEVATLVVGDQSLAVEVSSLIAAGPQVFRLGDVEVMAEPTAAGVEFYRVNGTERERLLSGQSFWFAWYGEHPETDWWPRDSS